MQISTEAKVGFFVLIALGILGSMAYYLGVFRFDLKLFNTYYAHFQDASGLDDKAHVKISGVKVGWVDDVILEDHGDKVRIKLMIRNKYLVHADAQVTIRQESLLGSKYIEIMPGSADVAVLNSGDTITGVRRTSTTASIESLLARIDGVAKNIEDVSLALKQTLGTEQQASLSSTMQNLAAVANNMAVFTDTLVQQREQFQQIMTHANQLTGELAPLGQDLRVMAQQINQDILPALSQNLNRVSELLQTDMGQVIQQLDGTMQSVKSVAEKIDHGDGLLGKLINESEVYDDLRTVSHGLKSYAALIDNMGVVVDTHFESMYRPAEDYAHPDSKGYFNFRLYTAEDWFYLFQLAGSERGGVIERTETINQYQNSQKQDLTDAEITQAHLEPPQVEKLVLKRNLVRYGLQFGKIFNNWCFRFGLFENSFGLAADYYIPFYDEKIRFISTLEAFDFRGQDRLDDRRPHLKWLNRIFILDSIYLSVGADDFVSKHNKNLFVGLGLRFTDDSLKYMFDRLGLGNNAR